MKKPRGKQPTKPDPKKALISRYLELKGSNKASFTIPIIFRKTFKWTHPGVRFVPINHRSFIIYKGDLDSEEYQRDMYSKVTFDVKNLPQYVKNRVKRDDKFVGVQLKEAILAASLKDRYVQITIPKIDNNELYNCMKKDMEDLVGELGFEYSTDHKGIQLTFKFPKRDIEYYAMESKVCVSSAINSLNHFRDILSKEQFPGAISGNDDLLYNINRLELLMDRYYSDALNIVWDLPNVLYPGYFLWINSCERIMDEFLIITRETNDAIKCLKPDDISRIGMDKDIFGYVWEKAIEKCLEFCKQAISTIKLKPDDHCISDAFNLIYNFEHHRKQIGANQSKFIKLFTGEEKYFKKRERAQRLLTASFHLINIFQASERIIGFSTAIAKNTLHIGMYK